MGYNKSGFVLCALLATVLAGCSNDESKQHYDNKAFISASGFVQEMRIEENATGMTHELEIAMAKREGRDIDVVFRAAPELLGTYREAYYDPDAVLLPSVHYDLSDAVAKITAGQVAGNPLILDFVKLDQLDLDAHYVLPVTVASANIDVLSTAKTMYYVFKEASLVNVVADINKNRLWPAWNDPAPVTDMTVFSLEALIYAHGFHDEISTIMGIEDVFLLRIGDALIPNNQIQVSYGAKTDGSTERGSVTSESLKLKKDTWYHVAVTYDNGEINIYLDGAKKASGTVSLPTASFTSVDFGVDHNDEADGKPRCFWIGYSYDNKRYLDGMISEARIWNKALTSEEINEANHFYKVDPSSPGLVTYWKFDEGAGNVVKDYTAYGNTLTPQESLTWYPVALPEKN